MAVKIRLKRMGTIKTAYYRIVVTDVRNPRDGKFLETVGTYDPLKGQEKGITLKADRIKYWISKGALPTQTVANILKKNGIR